MYVPIFQHFWPSQNLDAFGQAVLTWDIGRKLEVKLQEQVLILFILNHENPYLDTVCEASEKTSA